MVDTERMRRVLDRVRPGTPPMEPMPPPPGPMPPGPIPPPRPQPPPPGPPPMIGPVEWMRQEERLAELLRSIGRKSPSLRRSMERMAEASRARQRVLRRGVGGALPPPVTFREGSVSVLLRRGAALAGELREEYRQNARLRAPERRTWEELARSAGETEQKLQELQSRK